MAGYYPPASFHFRVEFNLGEQENDIRFQEVSGINAELDVFSFKAGGENRFTHEFPERAKYPDLVLKRGLLVDSTVVDWCRDAIEELDISPTNVLVHLLNEQHEPLQSYSFINAWPKKWELSSFNAERSEFAIETIYLSYQYFNIL